MKLSKLSNLYPIAAITLLILGGRALALPDDREQPIKVDATHFEGDRGHNLFVYSGNVVITQGSMQIRADRVEVHGTADNEIRRVIATGKPAHFQQQVEQNQNPVKARALRIEYSVNSDKLHLSGNAHVDRDGNTLTAEKIDYDLNSEQIQAQGQGQSGEGRVEMIWQPEKKTDGQQPPQEQ